MNPREHIAAALDFLELADGPISQRNALLRSELFWCAAAHAVKAVAKQRGWQNESHYDLFLVVRRLARELGNAGLIRRFNQASRLHRNMYEGLMSQRAIAESARQARQLVRRLGGDGWVNQRRACGIRKD